MAAFTLSRIGPDEVDKMVDLMFKVFTDEESLDMALGADTPEHHRRLEESTATAMKTNQNQTWIKVTDIASGDLIGISLWMIYPNVVPDMPDPKVPAWLSDKPDRQREIFSRLTARIEKRRQLYVGSHICRAY